MLLGVDPDPDPDPNPNPNLSTLVCIVLIPTNRTMHLETFEALPPLPSPRPVRESGGLQPATHRS